MKQKIYTILMMTALLAGCQETLEERAARESRDYTEKHCPAHIAYQVTMDSMTFDKASHTFGYYY
jgi:nitrous oxide reductase accessory protein NosL